MNSTVIVVCCVFLFVVGGVLGCSPATDSRSSGMAASHRDIEDSSHPTGVGIDSSDIVGMTDALMHDILAASFVGKLERPPKVVIDAQYFINESSSRINKNLITDRLRVALNKASQGKIIFVRREGMQLMFHEKMLAQAGITADDGSIASGQLTGADYRLAGRIATLDTIDPRTGVQSRYHQILFEIIDLRSGAIAWTDSYNFKKIGQEDIIYR